ncbi:MAG TPA: dTDP-4-dehydrorhamnose 3,5-epimerase [Vicinamibacterales bacterium]|nr:dTDP-4-dehydrorhamnose 3,5-epimerase [Vicinamibacterales bacterium]
MTFTETHLPGVWLIDADVFPDHRGAFVLAWTPEPFAERGLDTRIAQVGISVNIHRGTIRGLHYQRPPFDETKLIRVVQGGIFDVAVDLRPESPTFRQWVGVTLTAENRQMLYIPRGFAHGYQTLEDGTEALYSVSKPYSRAHQDGVRWDDAAFGIDWPLGAPSSINERDATYPDFVWGT